MGWKITGGVLLILAGGFLLLLGFCGTMFSYDNRDVMLGGGIVLGLLCCMNGLIVLTRLTVPTVTRWGAIGGVLLSAGVIGGVAGVANATDRKSGEAAVPLLLASGICLLIGVIFVCIRDKKAIREARRAYEEDEYYDDEYEEDGNYEDLGSPDRWDDA